MSDWKRYWFRAVLLALLVLAGSCGQRDHAAEPATPDVPRGFSDVLTIEHDGRFYEFGPFVGYYFKPEAPGDFSRVQFVCFNERGFYASGMPVNAKLFEGEGVLTELPAIRDAVPRDGERIRPVFFDEAPRAWLDTRPSPQDQFVHFHSLHDASGASLLGYWLRHESVSAFTYDMGGRVGANSVLYHHVKSGPDREFARIVEFDFGS